MINLEKLLTAIDNAETLGDVEDAKKHYGYTELRRKVNRAANKTRDRITNGESKERRLKRLQERKVLLNKHIGEKVYYIGPPFEDKKKNSRCELVSVDRTKCVISFKNDPFGYRVSIHKVHTEKTDATYLVPTKSGFKEV